MYIPAEIVALITFPGVILHEVSHRFFCDIFNVPVYHVNYFSPSKTAGHVIHAPIKSGNRALLVSIAPLIINSIVCMILTLPAGIIFYFDTAFLIKELSAPWGFLYSVLRWIGYTIGFSAIPSTQDMKNAETAENASVVSVTVAVFVSILSETCSIPFLGPVVSCCYAYAISLILPAIIWGIC